MSIMVHWMYIECWATWWLLALIVAVSGCSTAPKSYEVELGEEAYVSENGATAALHKKGDVVSLDRQSYAVIESPGRIGFVIPPRQDAAHIKLNFKRIADLNNPPVSDSKIDEKRLNEILLQVNRIQVLLSRGENQEALSKTEELNKSYPGIALSLILKANCLLVMGENSRAKAVLLEVLNQFPENLEAKTLLDSILDSRPPPPRDKS